MFLCRGFVFFLITHLFHLIRKATHITFSKEKIDKENNKKLAEFLPTTATSVFISRSKKFQF